MEVYAAMIDCMDRGIGRIVESLQETEQLENTLILFFQDNGGCAENYGRGGTGQERAVAPPLDALPPNYLQKDMQPKQTRDGYPVRTGKGVMAGAADTYIGYGKGWATVSNTPFREYKHWVHEGGISSPLIAHWPAGIEREGQLDGTPSHLIDLMATAVDLTGAAYPKRFHDGQEIWPMEGRSLAPVFDGQELPPRALYWEHEGNRAVRLGDFKLVAKGAQGAWELYNIAHDRSEQEDLAPQHPEKVQRLAEMWQAYAERAWVLPLTPYKKKKEEKFKKNKLSFSLSQDDNVSRNKGPYVEGRGITFSAEISEPADGVLVAQGGVTHGWAVYIQDSRLCFATTHRGERTVVQSDVELSGAGSVLAVLEQDGKVILSWQGQKIGQGQTPGALQAQPADGLQIGFDEHGSVGDYSEPFAFEGKISDAVIKLTQ